MNHKSHPTLTTELLQVLDEYDEQSEVAERLRIKVIQYAFLAFINNALMPHFSHLNLLDLMQSVPLFHFYKNGTLLEAFATRDKERILAAILKYTGSSPE